MKPNRLQSPKMRGRDPARSPERRSKCALQRSSPVSPAPVQTWRKWALSRRRCGRGEPSPGADMAGTSPVLVQM
jgi:hypothetical protein